MEEVKQETNNHKRKFIALGIFMLIAIIGVISVFLYVRYKSTHISTDDAFVEGRIHTIAAKVSGTVNGVHVADNQFVKKGDLLMEIDEADYDVRMKEAEAGVQAEKTKLVEVATKIDTANNQLSELHYRIEAAKSQLELQEANLRQAEIDVKRAESLLRKEAVSKERFEKTKTGYDVAVAQVKAAKDQLKQAEASLNTQKAVIRQAESARQSQDSLIRQKEATLKIAELNRNYTKIFAPSDGYITKKSVQTGNQIQPGQPLMAVVPLDDIWIIANYKETQLEKIKPGLKVEIKVDSYPKKVFNGKTESIMSGTGTVFSLFPPENATGNFVKVVQRIPVKIVLEKNTDTEHVLRIGMSVEPTVIIEK